MDKEQILEILINSLPDWEGDESKYDTSSGMCTYFSQYIMRKKITDHGRLFWDLENIMDELKKDRYIFNRMYWYYPVDHKKPRLAHIQRTIARLEKELSNIKNV